MPLNTEMGLVYTDELYKIDFEDLVQKKKNKMS